MKKRTFLSVFVKRLKIDVTSIKLKTLNVILQNEELSEMGSFSLI